MGASAYYIETFGKIFSVVNELAEMELAQDSVSIRLSY
jgi:hypothetical protein